LPFRRCHERCKKRSKGLPRPIIRCEKIRISSEVGGIIIFNHLSGDPARSWLTLAMSATLAGNFTILGSVANLIVIQRARHEAPIGFWEYFKVGAPLTVLSIAAGVVWVSL
jgi:Na+/H+ antiporter NhaD/arsenite permease-like protein